jgi:3-isopropylmalate/(R)-2-methylmalate dehydratase large subunit
VTGSLAKGVYAKDIILAVIRRLGVKGGIGYAYEFAGDTISHVKHGRAADDLQYGHRRRGAGGLHQPRPTTVEYLRGRPFSPQGRSLNSKPPVGGCPWARTKTPFDDQFFGRRALEPQVAWGIHPGQTVGVSEIAPALEQSKADGQSLFGRGLSVHLVYAGRPCGTSASTWRSSGRAPTGACRICARPPGWPRAVGWPKGCGRWWCRVPKSSAQAEAEGLNEVFRAAGFEWRNAGCSMCLAMNPDKLKGREICASSSNRNFIGRQGSATGRTLLMSPAMVAAAAVARHVTDVREEPMKILTKASKAAGWRCPATTSIPTASCRPGICGA